MVQNFYQITNDQGKELMKKIIFISLLALITTANATSLGGTPFTNPLTVLKNGPVHFNCHEVVGGAKPGGITLFQFDVVLGNPQRDSSSPSVAPINEITLSNVKIGSKATFPGNTSTAHYFELPPELFKNSSGSVMFGGTQYERINFIADYDGVPLQNHIGPEWKYSLDVEQDLNTMLIFVSYKTIHVVDNGQSCMSTPQVCEPRQRTIDNETFLCEAQ